MSRTDREYATSLLTLFVIWGVFLGWTIWTQPISITAGNQVTLLLWDTFDLPSARTVALADNQYFLIEREGGGMIEGQLSPRPIGWDDEYYYTNTAELIPGKWRVAKGSPSIVVSGESGAPITKAYHHWFELLLTLVIAIGIGALLWLMIMIIFIL